MPPLIDLVDVHRSYGPVRALRGVTLLVEPGVVGLVGNNGAGKSTLLKILLGLIRPTSGTGSVLGVDVRRTGRALRKRIGYMTEHGGEVPILTGVEYATLSGDLYGMPHEQARRRAHEVLSYIGLGELRYRRLEEYSTGNLQRLKLAAALVHDPELLLLDEPTSGLDPAGREAFLRMLVDLVAETKKSLILSTHLLGDVERLCQQVVVLDQGQVRHCGPLAELQALVDDRVRLAWNGPSEPFVAALRATGATVEPIEGASRALATLPAGLAMSAVFAAARSAGALVTEVHPAERDLEHVFFKLTHSHVAPAADKSSATNGARASAELSAVRKGTS